MPQKSGTNARCLDTPYPAPPAVPGGQEHEKFVLVHLAWAGWHYEISSDEVDAGT